MLLWTLGCIYIFETVFFPDIYPGVGLLVYMVALSLVFWGTSIHFSTVAETIYNPIFLKTKTNNDYDYRNIGNLNEILYKYIYMISSVRQQRVPISVHHTFIVFQLSGNIKDMMCSLQIHSKTCEIWAYIKKYWACFSIPCIISIFYAPVFLT